MNIQMTADRMIYARKAMLSLPRLLSNQDRNPYSPTYGCFHRDYWLDKTSDFPDAVRQFAVHALALVYSHDFEGNIYYQNERIRDWAIAGLDYWADIQHSDGSFDEFYPYERGRLRPSAFITYTSIESYNLLCDDMPVDVADRVRGAICRAATFIGKGENEADYLANHHAMACLTLWKAWDLLGESRIKRDYQSAWNTFLTYYNEREGWSREYDGVDPGYLSATVSFLGKIYKMNPDPAMKRVLEKAVEFSAYFVYPNGFYAGSIGSRNMLHFYPHGYEILADEIPLAGKIAEIMLQALGEDKLVPPEIISDRYVVYRVPELLLAFIDHKDRADDLPPLPYERKPFRTYFPESQILVETTVHHYTVANLAKGGIIKHFDRQTGELLNNDTGIIGELNDGCVVTSQWINPDYEIEVTDTGWSVSGKLNRVPSTKLFNPFKHILFRVALIAVGWNRFAAHLLKAQIRRTLILGQRPVDVRFERTISTHDNGEVLLTDTLLLDNPELAFESLQFGGEFFVRYVPRSRYFQSQELHINQIILTANALEQVNSARAVEVSRPLHHEPDKATIQYDERLRPRLTVRQSATATPDILSVDVGQQLEYWEAAGNRRSPEHPVIASFVQPKIDFIRSHLLLKDEAPSILDVGCGNGYFTHYWQQMGQTIGLDFARTMLRHNPTEQLVQGSADALPFPDNAFDIVFCSNLLHHVPVPLDVVCEMKRVSRRYVVISEPNRNNPAMLFLGLVEKEERLLLNFTEELLQSFAQDAGLHIEASRTMGLVTPNRMPVALVDVLKKLPFEQGSAIGAYNVLVASK